MNPREIVEKAKNEFFEDADLWVIVPKKDLQGMGFIEPSDYEILLNPLLINTVEDYFLTLAHEIMHWVFPEDSEEAVEEKALKIYDDPEFRMLITSNFGIPDWITKI